MESFCHSEHLFGCKPAGHTIQVLLGCIVIAWWIDRWEGELDHACRQSIKMVKKQQVSTTEVQGSDAEGSKGWRKARKRRVRMASYATREYGKLIR